MKLMIKNKRSVLRSIAPALAFLTFSSVKGEDAVQQKQAPHEFAAVLIDMASKKPVQSARIILAPKKEEKLECTIDTSLTGISNDKGEVRLQNVKPGEYVVFFNLSGIIHKGLSGKVVYYGSEGWTPGNMPITRYLGPLLITKGSEWGIFDGMFGVKNGQMYAVNFDLAMISLEGKLLTVRIPSTGSVPVKIEIRTDIGK
jgi:hypothetical protein